VTRVYGLWSRLVPSCSELELIELFLLKEEAEAAKAGLISSAWSDDEDFPDLYIKGMEVR
jgi:hypothetical protein